MRVINLDKAVEGIRIMPGEGRERQRMKGWNSCRSILHLRDGLTTESQKREINNAVRGAPITEVKRAEL